MFHPAVPWSLMEMKAALQELEMIQYEEEILHHVLKWSWMASDHGGCDSTHILPPNGK